MWRNVGPLFRPQKQAWKWGLEVILLSEDQKSTPIEIGWQGHVMRIFWRSRCHLPTCSSTEAKINAVYYVQVLKSLQKHINKKRPKVAHSWILYQDNATLHVASTVRDFWEKCEILTVTHPQYSPDLTPCDFWLFPTLKKVLPRRGDRKSDILQFTFAGWFQENHHDETDRKNE